jgi:hypothetical protein
MTEEIPVTGEALISSCGLYCGDCYRYKGRIADLARDLRKELRQEKFDLAAEAMSQFSFFAEFKNYPQCYGLLGEMVKLRCKQSCRGGGGPPVCKIRACCEKKSIQGCWLCAEFETCPKLDHLKNFHEDALLKNLKALQAGGVAGFLKGKRYF